MATVIINRQHFCIGDGLLVELRGMEWKETLNSYAIIKTKTTIKKQNQKEKQPESINLLPEFNYQKFLHYKFGL